MKQFLMITLIVLTVFGLVVASDYTDGALAGTTAGTAAASPAWVVAGAGCGCFGVGAAYLMPGDVPTVNLVGQSSDYALGYTESYKKAKSKKQGIYAWGGLGAYWVVYIATGGFGAF